MLLCVCASDVCVQGRAYTREREERFKAAIDGVPAAATGPGVGGVEAAAAAIATVVRKKGKVDPDDPTFIIPIVDMHARHARLVKEFCAGDKDCWRALKEAMEDLCNRKLEMETQDAYEAITIPSFIDTFTEYLDNVLSGKTSAKSAKLSSEDIDKTWKAALALFPYLHEKDVFKDAYRHALAKRLLNERCESVDSERAVVSELKSQSGNQFHQCEVMIVSYAELTTESGCACFMRLFSMFICVYCHTAHVCACGRDPHGNSYVACSPLLFCDAMLNPLSLSLSVCAEQSDNSIRLHQAPCGGREGARGVQQVARYRHHLKDRLGDQGA